MVARVGQWVVGLVAWMVGTLTILAALLSWALATGGGISIDALIPHVERALTPADGAFEVRVAGARLEWASWDRAPNIEVREARVKGPDGETVVALPELDVTLSARALLLHGVLAPVRIGIRAPMLVVARAEDGSLGLRGIGSAGDDAGGRAAALVRAAVARILDPAERPDDPFGYLTELRVAGGRVLLEDRISGLTADATDATLVLARAPGGLTGRLDLTLEEDRSATAVRVVADYRAATGGTDLDIGFRGLDPARFAALAPAAVLPLDRLDLLAAGSLRLSLDGAGRPSPVEFELTADRPRLLPIDVFLPGGIALDRLRLRGSLDHARARLALGEVIATDGGSTLRASGVLDWSEAPLAVRAEATVDRLDAAQLARFWSPELEPRARKWVVENITGGMARDGRLEVRLAAAELASGELSADAIAGGFAFDDMTVRYFEHLPVATGVAGEAAFTIDRMDFTVHEGRVGTLEARAATVALVELRRKEAKRALIDVRAAGPVPDALALIDHPPLGFASKLGIDPARTAGRAEAELHLTVPLVRDLKPNMVAVEVEAALSDAVVRRLVGHDVDLTEGALRLRADNRGVDVDGRAALAGVPVTLSWRENLTDGGPRRRYTLAGDIGVETLRTTFGVELDEHAWGQAAVEATVAVPRAGGERVEVTADLERTGIEIPQLAWRKLEGQPGRLRFTAEFDAGGAGVAGAGAAAVRVTDLALWAADLTAEGGATLAAGTLGPIALDLTRVVLGSTVTAVRWRPLDGGGHDVELDAQALDARPLLVAARGDDPGDGTRRGEAGGPVPPLRLALRADRVLFAEAALSRLRGELRRDARGVWRAAQVSGYFEGGAPLDLNLAPSAAAGSAAAAAAGPAQRLTLRAGDAGALLRLVGATTRISGGALELSAGIEAQAPELIGAGTLRVRDFMLTEAPALARLLTLASMTGISNLVQGRGIKFDLLEVPFRIGPGGAVTISDARASGSQLGLTLEGTATGDGGLNLMGTIVPLYALNSALGQVPVIGPLFTGESDEGVFAATYAVTGTRERPEFYVNPLSALAPGILRKLFQGIASGTLEPPVIESGSDR